MAEQTSTANAVRSGSGVLIQSEILERDGAENIDYTVSCLITNARELLIDVECNDFDSARVRTAIVGLDCALALVRKLADEVDAPGKG